MCEAETACVADAFDSCDARALDTCFLSPDETPACTSMCDHIYYDCGMSLTMSRADCGVGCSRGDFNEAQIACFTEAACSVDDMAPCFDAEPVDPCDVACAHVIDECGNDTWMLNSCTRACKAYYTDDQKACLTDLACTDDPMQTCFEPLSCQTMCSRVYNECGSAIGDGSQEDCEVLCNWGMISDSEISCFSGVACEEIQSCDETLQQPQD